MAVNRFAPHVVVLSEDEAIRSLVNGSVLGLDTLQIKVETAGKGWRKLVEQANERRAYLDRYEGARLVLVMDFDQEPDRRESVMRAIDDAIAPRVFVFGPLVEAENVKRRFGGSFEAIGALLAEEFVSAHYDRWNDRLIVHNVGELERLRELCKQL